MYYMNTHSILWGLIIYPNHRYLMTLDTYAADVIYHRVILLSINHVELVFCLLATWLRAGIAVLPRKHGLQSRLIELYFDIFLPCLLWQTDYSNLCVDKPKTVHYMLSVWLPLLHWLEYTVFSTKYPHHLVFTEIIFRFSYHPFVLQYHTISLMFLQWKLNSN